MSDTSSTSGPQWFYEEDGQRKGPVSAEEMIALIRASQVHHGTAVWRQGFPGWIKVEHSELAQHLDAHSPPPLSGDMVNNRLVWLLAFAPLLGYLLECVLAGIIHGGNEAAAELAMAQNRYWVVTVCLNIALAYLDEDKLRKAGYPTGPVKGWVWLVPVYLYQRAQMTRQNLTHFAVWMVCFLVMVAA